MSAPEMGRVVVDLNNRVLVGLLGPIAMLLHLGDRSGDTDAAELIGDIVQQINVLKTAQVDALMQLHELRNGMVAPKPYQGHDQQYRVLNIDDEVVWSGEWQVAGENGLQKLAAANAINEMRIRGTDFGMHIERYQRCRWVNLTTQAHDEPEE